MSFVKGMAVKKTNIHLYSEPASKSKTHEMNMTSRRNPTPSPKPEVANPELTRPDWTQGHVRNDGMLWLDKNENCDPVLNKVVSQVMENLPPETLFTYPESASLYKKLADWLGLNPENLVLTAGSDGAIRSVFEAFISPGDVVIHTQPTFAMYPVYCKMYGASAHELAYRISANGPDLQVRDILEAIEKFSPRLICLPNPDSPTGTITKPEELLDVIATAGRYGAVMLVDEAYYPFYDETVIGLVNEYPSLIVTRSTGKAWGMAGFRIGYAAASPEVIATLHKVRPMYEANTIGVAAFEGMLDHVVDMQQSIKRINLGKENFLNEMQEFGFSILRGHGNFLHVSFGEQANEVHAALADLVYYRKDFKEPCLRGFSRFSAAPPDQMERIVERIRQTLKK